MDCEPEFTIELTLNSTDPLYPLQYYLHDKTIGINWPSAMNLISDCTNIKVAVVDQGVDRDHEDLTSVSEGFSIGGKT